MKGQGASTRTINLRITSIRSFLKYCGQEDFELRGIYESVCQIQKLKEEKHPILYLRPEATAAILSAYDMNTQKHRRNRMILIHPSSQDAGGSNCKTENRASKARKPLRHKTLLLHLFCRHTTSSETLDPSAFEASGVSSFLP